MRFLIGWVLVLATVFQPLLATAAFTDFDRQEFATQNVFAKYNPGFESGAANWTSTPALTISTSTQLVPNSKQYALWDSSSAGQTTCTTLVAWPKNGNCEGTLWVATPSGTATHLITVNDGTNDLASSTIVSSTTAVKQSTGIFACSLIATTAKVCLKSVASNEPSVSFDNVRGGESMRFGTSTRAPNLIVNTTAGTGTYTPTAGTTRIKVRLKGGGGGGSGAGTTGQTGGGAGTASYFRVGASPDLLVGNGGGGGTVYGGVGQNIATGGTASLGTGPVGTASKGANGGSGYTSNNGPSPGGGSGYGAGGNGGNGNSASANSGAGGAEAGSVDAVISPVAAAYAYQVGAGGSAGSAGTLGNPGIVGVDGWLEITEFFDPIAAVNPADNINLTGMVFYVGSSTCPAGSVAADGTAISRTTYSKLFTAIGTTFGVGNGSTTFNVPDTRGIFVRGVGSQTYSANTYTGTLGTKEIDQFETHAHQVAFSQFASEAGVNLGYRPDNPPGAAQVPTVSTGGTETNPANIGLLGCVSIQPTTSAILANSVSTGASNGERLERATVNNGAGSACTVTSQSGTWISSGSRVGTGGCTWTIVTGTFSATPSCICSSGGNGGNMCYVAETNATSITVQGLANGSAADDTTKIYCMGPR